MTNFYTILYYLLYFIYFWGGFLMLALWWPIFWYKYSGGAASGLSGVQLNIHYLMLFLSGVSGLLLFLSTRKWMQTDEYDDTIYKRTRMMVWIYFLCATGSTISIYSYGIVCVYLLVPVVLYSCMFFKKRSLKRGLKTL